MPTGRSVMTPLHLNCLHKDEFIAKYGERAYEALPDDAFLRPAAYLTMARAVADLMDRIDVSGFVRETFTPTETEPFGPRDYITHEYLVEQGPSLRPVTSMN